MSDYPNIDVLARLDALEAWRAEVERRDRPPEPTADPDAELFEVLWAYDEGRREAFASRDTLRLAKHDPELMRRIVAVIGEGGDLTIKLGIWLRRQAGRDFGERRTIFRLDDDEGAALWALGYLPWT